MCKVILLFQLQMGQGINGHSSFWYRVFVVCNIMTGKYPGKDKRLFFNFENSSPTSVRFVDNNSNRIILLFSWCLNVSLQCFSSCVTEDLSKTEFPTLITNVLIFMHFYFIVHIFSIYILLCYVVIFFNPHEKFTIQADVENINFYGP